MLAGRSGITRRGFVLGGAAAALLLPFERIFALEREPQRTAISISFLHPFWQREVELKVSEEDAASFVSMAKNYRKKKDVFFGRLLEAEREFLHSFPHTRQLASFLESLPPVVIHDEAVDRDIPKCKRKRADGWYSRGKRHIVVNSDDYFLKWISEAQPGNGRTVKSRYADMKIIGLYFGVPAISANELHESVHYIDHMNSEFGFLELALAHHGLTIRDGYCTSRTEVREVIRNEELINRGEEMPGNSPYELEVGSAACRAFGISYPDMPGYPERIVIELGDGVMDSDVDALIGTVKQFIASRPKDAAHGELGRALDSGSAAVALAKILSILRRAEECGMEEGYAKTEVGLMESHAYTLECLLPSFASPHGNGGSVDALSLAMQRHLKVHYEVEANQIPAFVRGLNGLYCRHLRENGGDLPKAIQLVSEAVGTVFEKASCEAPLREFETRVALAETANRVQKNGEPFFREFCEAHAGNLPERIAKGREMLKKHGLAE